MSRLSCDARDGQLFLEGVIDETSRMGDLPGHAVQGLLVLDLAGITFINSQGVREWIRMQQGAERLGVRIELRRVAEPIVHQLNIIPATRGVSMVTSFYAPYECEYCDSEHDMVLDVRLHGAALARMNPPALACPDCGRPLMFSNPPELYFTFLGS